MSNRVDELVAMLTARICLSPDCSGDISCEDCQDIAREALGELATIAQDAEHLRKQRDAARAILADALHAMRDWGADEAANAPGSEDERLRIAWAANVR